MTIDELIGRYEEEARQMLKCCDLNRAEDGRSFYAQRAVQCARYAEVLKQIDAEQCLTS